MVKSRTPTGSVTGASPEGQSLMQKLEFEQRVKRLAYTKYGWRNGDGPDDDKILARARAELAPKAQAPLPAAGAPGAQAPTTPKSAIEQLQAQVLQPQAFNEAAYRALHPDVDKNIRAGGFLSGKQHYDRVGKTEGRALTRQAQAAPTGIDLNTAYEKQLGLLQQQMDNSKKAQEQMLKEMQDQTSIEEKARLDNKGLIQQQMQRQAEMERVMGMERERASIESRRAFDDVFNDTFMRLRAQGQRRKSASIMGLHRGSAPTAEYTRRGASLLR